MRKTTLAATLILVGALLLLPLAAFAQADAPCEAVMLLDAWARSSPAGAPNGAAYGVLVNPGPEADTLVDVTSDVAEAVELHEMIMGEGDMMQMRLVEDGFSVGPYDWLALQPGGLHIMLINLTRPLVAGESFDLTLHFEHGGEQTVSVPIHDMAAMDDEATAEPMDHTQPNMEMTAEPPATTWPAACEGVHVLGAWARPAGAAMPNSAAYGLLVNLTPDDETLTSVVSDVAAAVELHEMVIGEGDVMRMRPLEDGIHVPAGGTALLQPGGLHVMMIGLNQPLPEGEMLDLTFTFANSAEQTLSVPIREPEAGPMALHDHDH